MHGPVSVTEALPTPRLQWPRPCSHATQSSPNTPARVPLSLHRRCSSSPGGSLCPCAPHGPVMARRLSASPQARAGCPSPGTLQDLPPPLGGKQCSDAAGKPGPWTDPHSRHGLITGQCHGVLRVCSGDRGPPSDLPCHSPHERLNKQLRESERNRCPPRPRSRAFPTPAASWGRWMCPSQPGRRDRGAQVTAGFASWLGRAMKRSGARHGTRAIFSSHGRSGIFVLFCFGLLFFFF